MLSKYALSQNARVALRFSAYPSIQSQRFLHVSPPAKLSNFWVPAQRAQTDSKEQETGHDLLIRAGFLRQAHASIFHLLPLGLRVQDKIERLIDKHMQRLGASKVSLSCLSSEELWQRSGRLDKGRSSELLRFEDRKGTKYLLSPTHEEEITTIIANAVQSYKQLPLRLYQVSRKYRDEPRPRHGLLRGREFLMKDLYTFDATEQQARQTYEEVRKAYVAFLEELRLPYLTARADSGNMGGDLSHEYHFASPHGEDTIISCNACDYSINEELYIGRYVQERTKGAQSTVKPAVEHYVSKDRKTLCKIYFPADDGEPNLYAVKAIFPGVDSSIQGEQALAEHTEQLKRTVISFLDPRLLPESIESSQTMPEEPESPPRPPMVDEQPILLTKAKEMDSCPSCRDGKLKLQQAVEIGHTFHLGQRYSVPFEASVLDANNKQVAIEMGCHGIGVSRLIGAAASLLADKKGLNWPLAICPFQVMLIPAAKVELAELEGVYDGLAASQYKGQVVDVAIDDRDRPIGWKLNDADLVGYPFIVVLGKSWKDRRVVELQCRRLDLKTEVDAHDLVGKIRECGAKL
ncbi:hypothetical protein LTR37_000741 [Vermiconidia calcicola]|uniref:Uncharacterized protein n=1 Tax=Vermiconidia calcicola TaxID=1690605 RepID=A0ACC3NYF9_9PEZI|nr:hypothetical protein LTR37_000741 [Vermiconidia calcicola]